MDPGIPKIIEDMKEVATPEAVHKGDSIVYMHVAQRINGIRNFIGKMRREDYVTFEVEEEQHIARLALRDILTPEQAQSLYSMLHAPANQLNGSGTTVPSVDPRYHFSDAIEQDILERMPRDASSSSPQ